MMIQQEEDSWSCDARESEGRIEYIATSREIDQKKNKAKKVAQQNRRRAEEKGLKVKTAEESTKISAESIDHQPSATPIVY